MIQINFQYEGSTIIGYVPESWEEIKLRHFLALEGTTEPIKLLSLLTDLDLSFILNTRTNLTPYLNYVIGLINQGAPEFEKKPSRYIMLKGGRHKIPSNLDKITFGQSALIEQELAKTDQNEVLAMAPIMAIVMQPIVDKGKFNLEKAKDLEAEIKELPISQVYGNVFFFWNSLKRYMIFGAPGSPRYLLQTQ